MTTVPATTLFAGLDDRVLTAALGRIRDRLKASGEGSALAISDYRGVPVLVMSFPQGSPRPSPSPDCEGCDFCEGTEGEVAQQ